MYGFRRRGIDTDTYTPPYRGWYICIPVYQYLRTVFCPYLHVFNLLQINELGTCQLLL